MIKISDEKVFSEKIVSATGFQIVRFCAEWNGPCQIMGPIYEEMSMMYGGTASFYKIDVDEMPALVKELGITELPTILFYRNGIVVDFIIGLVPRNWLTEKMKKVLHNHRSE